MLLHQEDTHRIAQRPALVQALAQELKSGTVERLLHIDYLDGRVIVQIGNECQGGFTG